MVNLTVIEELLDNGTLAVRLHKVDDGSGVQEVDIYQLTGMCVCVCVCVSVGPIVCVYVCVCLHVNYGCVSSCDLWIYVCVKVCLISVVQLCKPVFYIAEDMGAIPLLNGSRDDVAILPLSPGSDYKVFASAVDNVGNRIPPQQQMDNFVLINYPFAASRCVSDCSGRGNCTVYATCECDLGYYGNDCSQGNIQQLYLA